MTEHPNDQADGFFDDGKNPGTTADFEDAWDTIFALERLSGQKDWAEMRRLLDESRDGIPFHDFSEAAFRRAAAEGHVDILEKMLARNFQLPGDAGAGLVEHLTNSCLPKAEGAITFLLEKGFKGGQAVLGAAARGTPAMMETLRRHDCDLLHGGASFALALHAGNAGTMRYLYDHGADLYAPAVVKGLYGVIEAFQAENPELVAGKPAEARHVYDSLRDEDSRLWLHYYAANTNGGPSLETLRTIPAGVADRGMTLMQIAARAGCFDDISSATLRAMDHPLTADDVLRRDKTGASVLSILAARHETDKIFDPRLWWRRPDDAARLQEALHGLGAQDALDEAAFSSGLQQQRLKNLARETNKRLRPSP